MVNDVIVLLSRDCERRARAGGEERQGYADRENLRNFGRDLDRDRALDNHIVGCRAEYAVARVLYLPWEPQVGVLGGIDVGGKVEVRGRRMPGPGDLAFRKHDKDDRPYVLVYCHENGAAGGAIEIIGWLYGREMRARAPGSFTHAQIFYIRPPYRSVGSLFVAFSRSELWAWQ